ncbi:MAG: iron ABC transporter substrate-binding protein [Candidatus Nanopelagicales bacterium]
MTRARPRQSGTALSVGALAVGALLLTGCGGDAAADSGTPQAEGSVVVYSGRSEELVGPILQAFTEETGIPLDVRYGDTSGLAAQLIEEGDRTPADVFLAQDAGALGAVADAGLFTPLDDALTSTVPAGYVGADGTWAAVTGRARVLVYDPAAVSAEELPASVYELTDPAWKGRVAIAPTNASFQSFVTGMRVADGDDRAREWLDGMVANDVESYEKNSLILDAVDAGQVDLGLINHYYWYEKAAEVGADAMSARIAFTEPGDPGSLVNVSGVGVLAPAAEDPRAAQLVEFLLSEQAQSYFAGTTFEYPMLASVPAADDLPALDTLQGPDVSLGDLGSLPQTLQMLQETGLL